MSKKKKKKRRSRPNIPATSRQPAAGASSKMVSAKTQSNSFNPDYAYVVHDLKRIGILAGSIIVIMVILAFFFG